MVDGEAWTWTGELAVGGRMDPKIYLRNPGRNKETASVKVGKRWILSKRGHSRARRTGMEGALWGEGGGSRRGIGGGGGGWIPKSTREIRAGIRKQLGFQSWKDRQTPNAGMADQDGGGKGGGGGGGGGRRGPRIYLGTTDRNRNQQGMRSGKDGDFPNAGIAE